MEHESDVYASDATLCEEVLDEVLLQRSCLVRKLCRPSVYGSIKAKVHQHALCGSKSCVMSGRQSGALAVALHKHVIMYDHAVYLGNLMQEISVPVVK